MAKHNKHKSDEEHKDDSLKDEAPVETSHDGIEESTADEHEETSEVSEEKPVAAHQGQHRNPFKRFWGWALGHKKISIPVVAVVLLAVLTAVPFTRYLLAGTVIKQSFPVIVVDAESGKPVSSATVRLAGKEATTNGEGRAEIRTNVGNAKLEITKKYYETTTHDVLVPIGKPDGAYEVKLKAKGRVVPVAIVNSISKKPVSNITLKADDGIEAKTDDDGKASLVVPADKKEVKVTLSGEGFNSIEATVTVTTEEVDANQLSITPSGKIYFLSNASGKIDLVKSNLDGTDRQTVLAGTGKEDRYETWMNMSRDQKYIALHSKRDGGEFSKLFLIETNNDKLTVMDEGEASFRVEGWSSDRFVYTVERVKLENWQQKRQSIKSYHAPSKKITTLADSVAESADYGSGGYVYTYLGDASITGEEVVYAKNWSWGGNHWGSAKLKEKQASLQSIKADGSQSKTIKSYPVTSIYVSYHGKPGELTVSYYQDNMSKYDIYKDGKATFVPSYKQEDNPLYLVGSPSGNKAAWSEKRDGKNVIFVGNSKGDGPKEIGRSVDFSLYGWFTDSYILLTKKGNELYIVPASESENGFDNSLKVTDYYTADYYH